MEVIISHTRIGMKYTCTRAWTTLFIRWSHNGSNQRSPTYILNGEFDRRGEPVILINNHFFFMQKIVSETDVIAILAAGNF